ncbi:ASCH domain-containing protein [Candidatus Shapirobacteria bacterium]|nr:ASCH domain-containing protein [Candidatus Shapirobacteria bacterium]
MDHIAIMNKKLGLIDRILSGRKKVETRWYKNKIAPYNQISAGETVYFKDSGSLVRAKARVAKVVQFDNLTPTKTKEIISKYGQEIDVTDPTDLSWTLGKNFAILIWLGDVKAVKPFQINKTGYGTGCAWLVVKNVDIIKAD